MLRSIHVAIDARSAPGLSGGIAEVTYGLVSHLHLLPPDEFTFSLLIGPSGEPGGLREAMPPNAQLRPNDVNAWPERESTFPMAATAVARDLFEGDPPMGQTQQRDGTGFLRGLGVDVVHGLMQQTVDSDLPLIYHPHDLQHLHLRENFDDTELRSREATYQYFCSKAAYVPVNSRWVADDLASQYGVAREKLKLIPWAPANRNEGPPSLEEIKAVCDKLQVQPNAFLLYPAAFWAHKNHRKLVEALALFRIHGREPPLLVFTGALMPFALEVLRRAAFLGVGDRIRFAGHVTRQELRTLYALSRGVVVPTRFEAGSSPVWEAFTFGVAVACSSVTSLPAQTAGAALLFDAEDESDVARVLWKLWTEPRTRAALVERAHRVVAPFTWELVVRRFGALYRLAAGRAPSPEDDAILNGGPRY